MRASKSIVKNVKVEISPTARANPPDPIEFVKALVEQHFAELVVRHEDFAFRPFFEEKSVSSEIRRLQTVPEHLAWAGIFAKHGCIHCHKKNLNHRGCGCCADCYGKLSAWKRAQVRSDANDKHSVEFKLSACDAEKLARAALMGGVGAVVPELPAPHSSLEAEPEPVSETTPGSIEPERHSAWCVICRHPQRENIERDYVGAGTKHGAVRAVARKYALKGTCGIYRHARAFGLNAKRAARERV